MEDKVEKKKTYCKPEIIVVEFAAEDRITTSGCVPGPSAMEFCLFTQ